MNKDKTPYKTIKQHHFSVIGENMAFGSLIVYDDETLLVGVEETDKNGQEDCHMSGVLEKVGNQKWRWVEGEETFVEYLCQHTADAIVKYINKHGHPDDE